jgi:hypothetical protein
MATQFDAKSFNPTAFKYGVDRVPNLKTNELIKSKALARRPDIKEVMNAQNGVNYARIAMKGLLDGDAVNYDGQTDITATSTKTFEQGVQVVGRAKAWTEKDFSQDVTGVDFMANIQQQVAEYKDGLDQDTLLAVLKGIFAMSTGTKNIEFVEKHTTDISNTGDGVVTATTLNSATNKACGANKKKFSLVIMHSDVATNLENLQLVEYLKYTDANGIQRNLELAQWGNKLVVIDDDMPVEEVEASGDDAAYNKYTTYVLGDGAIGYEDIGAKVPYEMDRDPKVNGGEDTMYMRQRKVFAPKGISYEKTSQATLSPTDEELANGANWSIVHSGESVAANRSYFDHKAIPICRIISRG